MRASVIDYYLINFQLLTRNWKKAFPFRRWDFLSSSNSDWRAPFAYGFVQPKLDLGLCFSPFAGEQAQLVQVSLQCLGVYLLFCSVFYFSIIWANEYINNSVQNKFLIFSLMKSSTYTFFN